MCCSPCQPTYHQGVAIEGHEVDKDSAQLTAAAAHQRDNGDAEKDDHGGQRQGQRGEEEDGNQDASHNLATAAAVASLAHLGVGAATQVPPSAGEVTRSGQLQAAAAVGVQYGRARTGSG